MPEIEKSIRSEPAIPLPTAAVRGKRFDPPHEIPRVDAASPLSANQASIEIPIDPSAQTDANFGAAWGTADNISPELIQHFRLQAQQLAAHLDSRQRDLDRREAELHARIAQQESTARNARLWFQERHNELIDRQTQIDQREQTVNSRYVELDVGLELQSAAVQKLVQKSLHQQLDEGSDLSSQHDQLTLRDLDSQQHQEHLDKFALELKQREQRCHASEQKLRQREDALEAAESALARSQVEWNDQQRQNQQQSADIQARFQLQQAKLADQQRRAEIELQEHRNALTQRSEQLERRGAALDQLRDDLLRIQRETLELRLATEELFAQMYASVPSATITQSLARLRTQLSDSFRLQAAEAAQQHAEAESLAAKVAQQYQLLATQKQEWQQCVTAQQHQIDLQAARLAAREKELNGQVEWRQRTHQEWAAQQHALECEVRLLRSELRHRDGENLGAA